MFPALLPIISLGTTYLVAKSLIPNKTEFPDYESEVFYFQNTKKTLSANRWSPSESEKLLEVIENQYNRFLEGYPMGKVSNYLLGRFSELAGILKSRTSVSVDPSVPKILPSPTVPSTVVVDAGTSVETVVEKTVIDPTKNFMDAFNVFLDKAKVIGIAVGITGLVIFGTMMYIKAKGKKG